MPFCVMVSCAVTASGRLSPESVMGTSTVPSDFSGVNVARAEESLFSEEGSCPAG